MTTRLPLLPRPAPVLLALAVLVASGAAFAISEGLKVQRAAVAAVHVDKIFSPVCRCAEARAVIGFKLTRSDRVTLGIVDSDGTIVRTLVHRRLFNRGAHHFTWNGRDDAGTIVPQGDYRPRVDLQRTGKTIVLPNPIAVDTTKPRIRLVSARPRVISPDGDGRSDVLHVNYKISEHAHAVLYVAGRQAARTKFQRLRDNVNWYGLLGGRRLPPGTYRIELASVDLAGNESKRMPAGTVRIRYVALPTRLFRAVPRGHVKVAVSTDAARVQYALRRGGSVVARGSSGPRLSLRAPNAPGRYVLVVQAAGHRAVAAVLVRKR